MRLRSRPTVVPARALPDDWIQPRRSGRSTTIGNLDSARRAAVDPAGLVTLDGASWSLDWWIGAEDRWHMPCREMAVRQALLGASPVVETRQRVPSGDAVHRAYAARDRNGAEGLVVEVHNESKVPFAVALAVRPYGQSEVGRIDALGLEGNTVSIDGRVAARLPKSPGRITFSDAAGGDSAAVLLAGVADIVRTASITCAEGLAQGALIFPLAHTGTLRVVLPLDPDGGEQLDPTAFPSAHDVASGWATQASQGARFEVPERRLREAAAASVRHLLLNQGTLAGAAALDLAGFPDEAAHTLAAAGVELARADRPGAALHTVVRHWELTHDPAFATDAVDLVGALVGRLGRATDGDDRARGAAALPGAAGLLDAAGEARAAADVRRSVDDATPDGATEPAPGPVGGPEALAASARLAELVSSAIGTWTWPGDGTGHDAAVNAEVVALVRALLVHEHDGGLVLCPLVPDEWLGQGWEIHEAPTRHGRLSYALRWHGDRPALLWQLDPDPGSPPVRLTAPGLDPGWSSTEPTGEALLSPVPVPVKAPQRGLSTPVTIASSPRGPR